LIERIVTSAGTKRENRPLIAELEGGTWEEYHASAWRSERFYASKQKVDICGSADVKGVWDFSNFRNRIEHK